MKIRLTIIAILTAAFIGGGWHIHNQTNTINDLRDEIAQVQNIRESETLHFGREIQRIEELSNLKALQEGFRHEAIEDTSDSNSHVGKSRVLRLNAIR